VSAPETPLIEPGDLLQINTQHVPEVCTIQILHLALARANHVLWERPALSPQSKALKIRHLRG